MNQNNSIRAQGLLVKDKNLVALKRVINEDQDNMSYDTNKASIRAQITFCNFSFHNFSYASNDQYYE